MPKDKKLSVSKKYAQIEYISLGSLMVRMGPVGLHVYAEHFLNSARSLPTSNIPFEPVRPYLVCHAIELGLKAFLSLEGYTMLDLADSYYGHDLGKILKIAEEKKLERLLH